MLQLKPIPMKDPGPPPISPDIREDRAARLKRVEELWFTIRAGGGLPVQRAAASISYASLLMLEEPGLLVDEAAPGPEA